MVALKRASRRPPLIAKTIAAIQPPLFSSCNCQKYRISAGRDAEIDEVREAVEFRAEFRLALDHARDAAIDAIEHGREHDGRHRQFHPPFGGQADRGQARADRQQRDDVGHQHPHRNRTKPAAAHFRIIGIDAASAWRLHIASARPAPPLDGRH